MFQTPVKLAKTWYFESQSSRCVQEIFSKNKELLLMLQNFTFKSILDQEHNELLGQITNKQTNTFEFLVGIMPTGAITFLSNL